jgi:DNA-binding transcriptional MerR regulator
MMDLPQSVLRYWETVFESLTPRKSSGGNRQYSEEDIEIIKRIKALLYDQGFTIKGAKNKLISENSFDKEEVANNGTGSVHSSREKKFIIHELKEIIKILES